MMQNRALSLQHGSFGGAAGAACSRHPRRQLHATAIRRPDARHPNNHPPPPAFVAATRTEPQPTTQPQPGFATTARRMCIAYASSDDQHRQSSSSQPADPSIAAGESEEVDHQQTAHATHNSAHQHEDSATVAAVRARTVATSKVGRADARLADLAALLGVPATKAEQIARLQPSILKQSPGTLAQKFDSLVQLLRTTRGVAAQAVALQPDILMHSTGTLQASLETLSRVLSLPADEVAIMVRARPTLLCARPETLEAKLQGVAGTLGVPLAGLAKLLSNSPRLIAVSTSKVEESLGHLGQVLGISPSAAQALAVSYPRLLLLAPATLERNASAVTSLLQLGGSCNPLGSALPAYDLANLLLSNPVTLRQKFDALQGLFPGRSVRGMVAAYARLLQMRPETLEAKKKVLEAAAAGSVWEEELATLPDARYTFLLRLSAEKIWRRTDVIRESGGQEGVGLFKMLGMSEKTFERFVDSRLSA